MNAECAYLFRHALLRDAAYQLQLPGDRGRLHGCSHGLVLLSLRKTAEASLAWRAGASILREFPHAEWIEAEFRAMREACTKAAVEAFD